MSKYVRTQVDCANASFRAYVKVRYTKRHGAKQVAKVQFQHPKEESDACILCDNNTKTMHSAGVKSRPRTAVVALDGLCDFQCIPLVGPRRIVLAHPTLLHDIVVDLRHKHDKAMASHHCSGPHDRLRDLEDFRVKHHSGISGDRKCVS